MKKEDLKRINISNKIYPIFYGLSSDLVFWVAINTLFLTTVKGLSAVEISSLTTISTIVTIITYFFSYRIINKIGNISSVRLGVSLVLLASLFLTFGTNYFLLLIGEILYEISFVFKGIDSVILIKNLEYQNKENDYIKIQNKASIIYSFTTLIISILSGILFNKNHYLPMICCITICVVNVILSLFIYEINDKQNNKVIEKSPKSKILKKALFIMILYGMLYGAIVIGQDNGKLFIQYKLSDYISIDKVAIYISIIIALSRVVRLISNLFFMRIYNKLKDNVLYLISSLLTTSFLLFIIGNFMNNYVCGIIIMAIGFFIFLAIRDPLDNYLKTILMKNVDKNNQEQAALYFQMSRKISTFIISFIVTAILFKLQLIHVYIFLFIISIIFLFIVRKLFQLIKK